MKISLKLLLTLFLATGFLQVHAQSTNEHMTGSWQGVLNVNGVELRLAFNLSLNEEMSWKATLDSPDQGATGIPLGEVRLSEDSIRIEAPGLMGFYVGKMASPSKLEGEWHQAGRMFKLDLEKKDEGIVLNRPQEPQAPYPYKEVDVVFQNTEEDFSLAGTLSLPDGEGTFPAAVLISGSGSQNRDEEIFGHKPFKVIADYLTRNGIAVLRYDDRGVGGSGGNVVGATSSDLAVDARAGMEYLLTRKEIDPSRIGVIGHSEGALIAFLLSSSHEDFAYVVSLAGPGVDGKSILLEQSEHINSLSGVSDPVLQDNRKVMNRVYDIMIDNESYGTWREETLEFINKYYRGNPAGRYGEADIEQLKENIQAFISESSYDWIRHFIMLDPAPLFSSIECPVLALNGEKDCQVLPGTNIAAIEKGLQEAGNTASKTMILPGLNHLFQNCETGLLSEYGLIEETFDPATLELISNWIWQQVR